MLWDGEAELGELSWLSAALKEMVEQKLGELPSSHSSEGCEGLGQNRGVYESSSCSLFLLGFVAPSYCQVILHRQEEEVVLS